MENTFKERIVNDATKYSKLYNSVFLDYEYLICSEAFNIKDYYIINAQKDNYQHLIGVHSLISAKQFFDKCYNGTLTETDFDFIKKGQSEKEVKGSVRRKIKVLPFALSIFDNNSLWVEEEFIKNNIFCSFATSDNQCTFGFINHRYSVPKTLLKQNMLNQSKCKPVDLILKKHKFSEKFDCIVLGNDKNIEKYYEKIKNIVNWEI